jgi:hypothetical protein
MRIAAMTCLTSCFVSTVISALIGAEPSKQILPRVTNVVLSEETSYPPNLVISISGEVQWNELTMFTVLRAQYDVPPSDGIQDIFVLVYPITKSNASGKSEVAHQYKWMHCTRDAPWLRGVRVHSANGAIEKIRP